MGDWMIKSHLELDALTFTDVLDRVDGWCCDDVEG